MAKRTRAATRAARPRSPEAERVARDGARIRRELAAVRRLAALSRMLAHAAARVELGTFQLGRQLVTERGWAVVESRYIKGLEAANADLRARLDVLAAENAGLASALELDNEGMRQALSGAAASAASRMAPSAAVR